MRQMSEADKETKKNGRTPDGKFAEGNPGGGRPKGSENKYTADMRKFILDALYDERVGGLEGFIEWLLEKPQPNFPMLYGWVFKMLPSNVNLGGEVSITFEVSEKFLPDVLKGGEEEDDNAE